MFIVTNRTINASGKGLKKLGNRPNSQGPHELRLLEIKRKGSSWEIDILPDKITDKMKKEIGIKDKGVIYASQYAAKKLLTRMQKNGRNLLFFVHGFNNDLQSVIERAELLEKNYGVEVLPFSWPANGGGVQGVASYKSDKRDAKASVGALDACLLKLYQYLEQFNEERNREILKKALKDFPDNAEKRDQFITRMTEKGCPFTVNMIAHSMGNYLFKHVLSSSVYRGTRLLFDNVILAAADTNNKKHVNWVDKIRCRKRVYITINEDDSALMASRMKGGEEQLARLGHYPYNLYSQQSVYLNFTNAKQVGRSHAYFEDALKNKKIKTFFNKAFNGERGEQDLAFDPSQGTYNFPK